ncbi:VOC family protein [Aeromicrobium duanguangcaii]|uniref:VOC family protein n=1 Tax=Aeromicrobium duanguangcaii TaxID=2968086 RepID=UPI0020172430|nr:VOC family protein [Aeromicrobium duanguangcaii]MCL3838107.1 VOC family protein [Aeromicrobium duanguangcaii]
MTDDVTLGIAIDCTDPRMLARFWTTALPYVAASPPAGWASWEDFLTACDVPESEWNDGASIEPANGSGPTITFLKVPEPKQTKNRVHLDVKVSGGRRVDPQTRESRIRAKEAELVAAGAVNLTEYLAGDHLDHLVMADPEDNEFCIV